jgi:hypothetical protein
MSVYVIRAFIRLREMLADNLVMAPRLAEVDKTLLTYDTALRDIYLKIRSRLLPLPEPPRKKIGLRRNLRTPINPWGWFSGQFCVWKFWRKQRVDVQSVGPSNLCLSILQQFFRETWWITMFRPK